MTDEDKKQEKYKHNEYDKRYYETNKEKVISTQSENYYVIYVIVW